MVDIRPNPRSVSPRRRRRYRLRSAQETRVRLTDSGLRPGRNGADIVHLNPLDRLALAPRTGLAGRRFLIVTAPFGPFGRVMAEVLEARGAQVERMIFNAADFLDWRRSNARMFRDTAAAWSRRLPQIASAFTDIVVFGEGGPYNRAVLSQAESLGARVWVLENGYFRPDWVTVERDGVNGSSRLPRFRDAYASPPPELPPVRHATRILPHHVAHISAYHALQFVCGALFPRFATHYSQPAWRQCLGHIRRYVGLAFRSSRHCEPDHLAGKGPYFIVCLQREGDAQLLRYSRYADNTAFMAEAFRSFAAHAPADCRLVVKNHPLDPGLVNLEATARRLAGEFGLEGKVDFIDGGNLAKLCRMSRGMIVNNSSAALSALGFHTPVKVMGDAFFDFEGLTDQRPLDQFWDSPVAPDAALFNRFRGHVIAQAQVNGNYHEPAALWPTACGVADVFERDAL